MIRTHSPQAAGGGQHRTLASERVLFDVRRGKATATGRKPGGCLSNHPCKVG